MLDRLTIERIGQIAGEGPILVALSGGGDSTALLHLMAAQFGADRLRAGVIDHALRSGSDADAARASGFADAIGVEARILKLSWGAGDNRGQAAARAARYRALCGSARELGARVLVTGHNRDDQAETVLMRAARGGGWRGLAAMRAVTPAPVWPEGRGLWLARPLLSVRRAPLRAYLRERGADWIDDPANANPDYERVVARAALAREEAAGLDPMRLAAIAERVAPYADEIDTQAAVLIASAVRFADDAIIVSRASWRGPETVRERALWALVAAAGGAATGPSSDQVRALEAQLIDAFAGATLGGARLKNVGADIVITRDTGGLSGRADGAKQAAPTLLPVGEETVWDGRMALTAPEPGWSVLFEAGAARLARGEERAALTGAKPIWLLHDRVRHLLGRA